MEQSSWTGWSSSFRIPEFFAELWSLHCCLMAILVILMPFAFFLNFTFEHYIFVVFCQIRNWICCFYYDLCWSPLHVALHIVSPLRRIPSGLLEADFNFRRQPLHIAVPTRSGILYLALQYHLENTPGPEKHPYETCQVVSSCHSHCSYAYREGILGWSYWRIFDGTRGSLTSVNISIELRVRSRAKRYFLRSLPRRISRNCLNSILQGPYITCWWS